MAVYYTGLPRAVSFTEHEPYFQPGIQQRGRRAYQGGSERSTEQACDGRDDLSPQASTMHGTGWRSRPADVRPNDPTVTSAELISDGARKMCRCSTYFPTAITLLSEKQIVAGQTHRRKPVLVTSGRMVRTNCH